MMTRIEVIIDLGSIIPKLLIMSFQTTKMEICTKGRLRKLALELYFKYIIWNTSSRNVAINNYLENIPKAAEKRL